MPEISVEVEGITHRFGAARALDGVSFSVGTGQMFALLGPNGGGKSTMFRLLATVLPLQGGRARTGQFDLRQHAREARGILGVVFQHPSLDRKLTVRENLGHHGKLFGIWGKALRKRIEEVCEPLGLSERLGAHVEILSGGWQRRAEIAKALVPRPQILLLDEPTTGLDPAVRRDFWQHMESIRMLEGCTVLLTTHLMEEAAICDRVTILDHGKEVATGAPVDLVALVSGSVVTAATREPGRLIKAAQTDLGIEGRRAGGGVRFECQDGASLVRDLSARYPDLIDSVTLARPTLEDLFFAKTGHGLNE